MRRRTGKRIFRRFVLFLLILLACYVLFRSKLYPVVGDLGQAQVDTVTSDLINDAINRQIETGNLQYDRLVYFEKDLNGRITALKANMGEINRLKTQTLSIIDDEVLALDASELGLPMGSLILPELFSGKGPTIPIRILSIRNSDASFSSSFSAAGINQTLHQINMAVSMDVTVLVLGGTRSFTVSSQVVVAETVIVGDVPNTLLQTGG